MFKKITDQINSYIAIKNDNWVEIRKVFYPFTVKNQNKICILIIKWLWENMYACGQTRWEYKKMNLSWDYGWHFYVQCLQVFSNIVKTLFYYKIQQTIFHSLKIANRLNCFYGHLSQGGNKFTFLLSSKSCATLRFSQRVRAGIPDMYSSQVYSRHFLELLPHGLRTRLVLRTFKSTHNLQGVIQAKPVSMVLSFWLFLRVGRSLMNSWFLTHHNNYNKVSLHKSI